MRFLVVCLGLLATASLSASSGLAQDDENRGGSREDRLQRIEEAIKRLETALPKLELEGDLAEQVEEALDDFDEFELEFTPTDRFVIGVMLDMENEAEGIRVSQVMPESAAAEAGVMAGDQIVAVNGEEIEGPEQLIEVVQENGSEQPLELSLQRDDETITLKVTPQKATAQAFTMPNIEIPNIELPNREGEELRIPRIVIPENIDPEVYKELIPKIEKMREGLPEGGFKVMPPVFLDQANTKAEMEELRAEMNELRDQMKAMAEQLKAIQKSLDDD